MRDIAEALDRQADALGDLTGPVCEEYEREIQRELREGAVEIMRLRAENERLRTELERLRERTAELEADIGELRPDVGYLTWSI